MKIKIDYVEIGGVKWATKNVGAEKETDIGLYFQSGSKQGYSHPTNLCKFSEIPTEFYDSVQAYLGGNWRMPTKEEFDALLSATTNEWITDYQGSGVNGRLFTDKNDNSKKLFFPANGLCCFGNVYDVGDNGLYWSSSHYSDYARCLYFYDGNIGVYSSNCYCGYGVRGVLTDK